jgi:hypothetical protein
MCRSAAKGFLVAKSPCWTYLTAGSHRSHLNLLSSLFRFLKGNSTREIVIIDSDEGELSGFNSVMDGKCYLLEKPFNGMDRYQSLAILDRGAAGSLAFCCGRISVYGNAGLALSDGNSFHSCRARSDRVGMALHSTDQRSESATPLAVSGAGGSSRGRIEVIGIPLSWRNGSVIRGYCTDGRPFWRIIGVADLSHPAVRTPSIQGRAPRSWVCVEFEVLSGTEALDIQLRRQPSLRFDNKITGILRSYEVSLLPISANGRQ